MGRKNYIVGRKTSFLKSSSGFTLSEALVTIAILAIFILIVIVSLRPSFQIAKSRDTKRKTDIKTISIGLEDYLGDHPCYPPETVMECNPGTGLRPYLGKIPCDPRTDQSYAYVRPDGCTKYAIYANLEIETAVTYDSGYNYGIASSNYRLIPTVVPTTAAGGGGPTSVPTSASGGGTPIPTPTISSGFWGCISGVCTPLPGFVCQPNFARDDCINSCGSPADPQNECILL